MGWTKFSIAPSGSIDDDLRYLCYLLWTLANRNISSFVSRFLRSWYFDFISPYRQRRNGFCCSLFEPFQHVERKRLSSKVLRVKCVDWRRGSADVHQMDQQFTSQQSMKTFQKFNEGGFKWWTSKKLMKWNQLLEIIRISVVIPELCRLDQRFTNIWKTRSDKVHQRSSSWYRISITWGYKMNLSSQFVGLWTINLLSKNIT